MPSSPAQPINLFAEFNHPNRGWIQVRLWRRAGWFEWRDRYPPASSLRRGAKHDTYGVAFLGTQAWLEYFNERPRHREWRKIDTSKLTERERYARRGTKLGRGVRVHAMHELIKMT
jgi:hypothetical protein